MWQIFFVSGLSSNLKRLYASHDSSMGCQKFWVKSMPLALPPGVASGGLVAAVVSTLLQDHQYPPPVFAQDILAESTGHWHSPSFFIGLLVGLFLAQVLELLYLVRQSLVAFIRSRSWGPYNAGLVKNRIA